MIVTTRGNLKKYSALNPLFPKAFTALEEMAEQKFTQGRYQIDGDGVFINAFEYDTAIEESLLMEAHQTYIDVMWIVDGMEQIAVCPVENMTEITMPYDPAGDAALSKIPAGCTYVQMMPGTVCILFPEDGHAPGLSVRDTSRVQKRIAKVRVV